MPSAMINTHNRHAYGLGFESTVGLSSQVTGPPLLLIIDGDEIPRLSSQKGKQTFQQGRRLLCEIPEEC